jgi:hypothetical protein
LKVRVRLVQVPENRNTDRVLETSVIDDVAELQLRGRILLQGKAIVEVDAEILDENVEGELGNRER